jgi:hypothetical protein
MAEISLLSDSVTVGGGNVPAVGFIGRRSRVVTGWAPLLKTTWGGIGIIPHEEKLLDGKWLKFVRVSV